MSKNEKKVFLLVASGGECPATFPRHIYTECVHSLERKGLLHGAYIEGGDVEAVRITSEGRCFLAENPRLKNPVDWKWIVTTGIAIIGVAISIVALFVACKR